MSKNTKWAYTLINSYSTCKRQYYFGHILPSHHHSTPLRRKAFELKQMVNIEMWQGKVVDLIIEKEVIPKISNKERIDFEKIANNAVDLAKAQYNFSLNKEYRKKGIIKTNNNLYQILDIHELETPIDEKKIILAYENIKRAILNFPKVTLPNKNITLLEYLRGAYILVANVQNRIFTFDGIQVSPQIDLLLYHEGKPVIIDWKVSNSSFSDYSRQLVICGLTLYMNKLEKCEENGKEPYDYDDITLYEVNLANEEMKLHEFDADIAQDMMDYIFITGKDMAFNKQKKKWNDYKINDLDWAENESACNLCNFQSLCSFLFENKNQYNEEAYLEFIQNTEPIEN